MITQSMQKELEKHGYFNITEDILKDLDNLNSEMRQDIEHIMVEDRKKDNLNTISTLGMPIIVSAENKNNKDKNTLADQIKEGRNKELYAASQGYVFDKGEALDEAYNHAKRYGMNAIKLKEAVAEMVESRQDKIYNITKEQNIKDQYINTEEYLEKNKKYSDYDENHNGNDYDEEKEDYRELG